MKSVNEIFPKGAGRKISKAMQKGRKWSMHVDGKKIKTYTSKRAAVIAHNKFMKDTDNWKEVSIQAESINEGKVEPKVKSQLNILAKRLTDLKRADTQLEKSMWEPVMAYTKIYNMVKDGKYSETAGFKQLPGSLELNHKRFSQKFSKSLDSIIKSTKDSVKRLQLKESVNESIELPHGMKLGKVFTGHGKSFVKEAVEPAGNIKKVLDVAKNQQSKKIGSTLVDLTTANLMTQVWNKVNDSSKEKMNKMNAKQLTNLILRIWKGVGTPRV